MAKWVYSFEEGSADMRNLLGGKGANLAEMTNLGLPIPQGFTVTTEACTDYYANGRKISEEIQDSTPDSLEEIKIFLRLAFIGAVRIIRRIGLIVIGVFHGSVDNHCCASNLAVLKADYNGTAVLINLKIAILTVITVRNVP